MQPLLLLALYAAPWLAHAALGGAADSVAIDEAALHAQRRLVLQPSYATHELQLASGTIVREFVGTQGAVFAVSWRGLERPDLRQILGQSFALYQEEIQQHHTARSRHVAVDSPQLVMQSHGTMRLQFGYALIPSLLPAGVRAEDLRP